MKDYYKIEFENTVNEIKNSQYDLSVALVTDSHLDNSLSDTLMHIKAVDEAVGFDCLVHLGDFLNGNLPRKYTKEILAEQMEKFSMSVGNGRFLPVQGNHDGFVDFAAGTPDMALDEDWDEAVKFTDSFHNLSRNPGKPYFYMDYPDKKLRMVVICSFHYIYDEKFDKQYGISKEQVEWLRNDALKLDEGWTVIFLSHDVPFEEEGEFDEAYIKENNARVNGNLTLNTVVECRKERGFDIAAWIVGHFHGDMIKNLFGINFVVIGCETAYVPTLWDMPEGGVYYDRKLNDVTEDLWDAALVNLESRSIKFIRFGAGENREISY